MALIVAGLLSVIALTVAHPTPIDWVQFKAVHDKNYGSLAEEYFRQQIFEENMKMIEEHNRRHKLGLESFSMEMNQFGDLTNEEFHHSILCVNMSTSKHDKPWPSTPALNVDDLPASVDWREQGAVTPVKNQKMCGSCWAFSTTGSLEGQVYKKEGKLVGLSEQNLVDCSGRYGNNGCNGGLMDNAFRYIIANGGIDTEEAYPYEAKDNKCRYNKDAVGAVVNGFVDIDSGNEEALAEAVANVGPIAVAIDASANSFRFYKSGVYYNAVCAAGGLNHAVLAVGYGTENGQEYWLVKNSWSMNWGDNGYIKMAKNRNNHCGIASYASYPVL